MVIELRITVEVPDTYNVSDFDEVLLGAVDGIAHDQPKDERILTSYWKELKHDNA